MDEREKRAEYARKAMQQNAQRRRPGGSDQRPGSSRPGGAGPGGQRPRRKSSRARRRKRNLMIRMVLLVLLIIIAAGGLLFWKKYGSSKEKADLKQYYGIQDNDDLAVVVNNQIIGALEESFAGGKLFDGIPYIEYSVVRDYINERFYWDSNENVLLYTLPGGSVSVNVGSKEYTDIKDKKSEDYVILKTEGKTAYIALAFIKQYTDMEYSTYEDPVYKAVIDCDWSEKDVSTFKRDTQVRYQGGVKSPILTEVEKSQKVWVLEDEDDWMKVRTSDGFIGYVKTSSLRKTAKEVITRDFQGPEYTNISVDYTINMAWHNVENDTANSYILEMIANTKGLTTIAPTWFSISDTDGNISSLANSGYVNYAHQSNIDVWATLRDFHGGINSYNETYDVLSHTSKRENLINQVIASALQTGIDGINLDFELVSPECGEHFIQFVRELSVKCRQNELVFTIDNYVPMPYNEQYNLAEQGKIADYVIIMGYDEHTDGSYEAGSVASYDYVKNGIEDALKVVPNTKLVNAIPFYTRLWLETPKTEEELAAEAGTEAADYPHKVTGTAVGMDEAEELLNTAGVQAEWDDKARQNYAQWETDGGTYKIWLEDSKSIEEKLILIKDNELAGVAEWRLGWENSGIWDLILQYVN
ncbi:glycosyl hydrolase family 18 protein [Faecalicatena contorta]|uniref:Spore germination protein YaaH n=1 Tax=Faecalicatena contorta TaxID=39482 RepID=A0A315ZUB2_9FIRM|nr:glycosyl hydrolase family 18 protein [Faecalicatena contorta]PWJ49085.1 spore germination protein YaaH [Faecalicatena contorta]SUQ14790.1 Spore germination protein YaaH [Faecalicatena contorta]